MNEIIIIKKDGTLINLKVNTDNLEELEQHIETSKHSSLVEIINLNDIYYLYGYVDGSIKDINRYSFRLNAHKYIKTLYNDCICMKKIDNKLCSINRLEFLKNFKTNYSGPIITELENNNITFEKIDNNEHEKIDMYKIDTDNKKIDDYEMHTDFVELLIRLNKYLVNKQLYSLDNRTNVTHIKLDENSPTDTYSNLIGEDIDIQENPLGKSEEPLETQEESKSINIQSKVEEIIYKYKCKDDIDIINKKNIIEKAIHDKPEIIKSCSHDSLDKLQHNKKTESDSLEEESDLCGSDIISFELI
tara:strand:+ start:256 stop:1164 length:909 start_codon:yes stop_codon:yes gene_type:complete